MTFVRYDTGSLKVLEFSTVPFTVSPGPGQADLQLADGTVLPDFALVTPDLKGLVAGVKPVIPIAPKKQTLFQTIDDLNADVTIHPKVKAFVTALKDLFQ